MKLDGYNVTALALILLAGALGCVALMQGANITEVTTLIALPVGGALTVIGRGKGTDGPSSDLNA